MIVGSGQRHHGIDESRLLQAKENRIGAKFGAEAALAEFVIRLAGLLGASGIPDLSLFFTAAFEHAQHVAGLRGFPAIQRRQFRKHALRASFFAGWWWNGFERLRPAVAIVTFAEAGIFCRDAAVIVERRVPKHARVRHHAGGNGACFAGMAANAAAGFRCDAQIARIYKFDVLRRFLKPFCKRSLRPGAAIAESRIARLNVGLFFCGQISRRVPRGAWHNSC
jgi:hypothetical protein